MLFNYLHACLIRSVQYNGISIAHVPMGTEHRSNLILAEYVYQRSEA